MSNSVLCMFSSKNFIVSGLTFKSLIPFEFIFVYGVRKYSNLTLTCSCPVFPAPLTEEDVFSPLYIFASFVEDEVPVSVWVYHWAFYLVPLVCGQYYTVLIIVAL